jgi:Fe-S cluster assembly scaffold protein SufB
METDFRDVDLSHEAAIGRIRKEEIEYLCSRGFTRDQAQSIIVRGFMDVNILGLPDILRKEIDNLEEKTLKDSF